MTWTSKVPALLAGGLILGSCTEPNAPSPGASPGTPLFSYSATGASLNREIVSLSQSGSLFIKGFNPTSPHNGDAVIATVYWLGSTNIIDSVVDVTTTNPYTHLGNTYHLVQFVTAGGLSMATYVATNVQGFPDGASDPNPVYAVAAYLHQSVVDGGLRLSTWTGVEDVFGQAIGTGAGAPRSASGSGTVPTVVSAGPIAPNAGAIVYSASVVTLPVGVERGAGFTPVGDAGSDAVMKDDAVYAVAGSSGTANPEWTWFFDQLPGGGTWLATSLTLNVAPPPNQPPVAAFTVTCSDLVCSFTNTSSDPDGTLASSAWTFGDGGTSTLQDPSNAYSAGGSYTVTLRVTDDAGAESSPTSQTVTVTSPPPALPATGALTVTTTSSGAWIPTTYGVAVDGTESRVPSTGSVTFTALPAGSHTVALVGVPARCTVSGVRSQTVTVTGGQTTTVSYSIYCNERPVVDAGPTETVLSGVPYSLRWSFTDPNDLGPWTYTIDWSDGSTSTGTAASEGTFTTSHTFVAKQPKTFTVRVNVTDASGATGSNTKPVKMLRVP